jgi:hypothetical protein
MASRRQPRSTPPKAESPSKLRFSAPGGWHAFAWELTIVVLGVLIALVIGQLAQAWQDSRNSAEARVNIRAEIGEMLGAMRRRGRTQPCIERRLDEVDALLAAPPSGRPFARPGWIGRPQVWTMSHARLDAAAQAGRASLLSSDEQAEYASLYASFAVIDRVQQEEQSTWAQLRGLENLSTLSLADMAAMRSAAQQARLQSWRIRIASTQAAERAAELGIAPTDDRRPGSRSVCLPIATPRAEALRQLSSPYGEP